jgi:transposase-like protein
VSIDVEKIEVGEPLCTSRRERHRNEPARAILLLRIGDHASFLCEECAIATLNSLAFMTASITEKSIQTLLGFKKGKR